MTVRSCGSSRPRDVARADHADQTNVVVGPLLLVEAPVGYLNCGRNAVPSLKPDPERAEVVRETFARVASGETPQSVYLDLVERGFTTRRGSIIGRQTFYSILRNPAYKRQLVTRLGFGVGDWDALVDEDIWEQVQAVVSQPGRRRVSGEMPGACAGRC